MLKGGLPAFSLKIDETSSNAFRKIHSISWNWRDCFFFLFNFTFEWSLKVNCSYPRLKENKLHGGDDWYFTSVALFYSRRLTFAVHWSTEKLLMRLRESFFSMLNFLFNYFTFSCWQFVSSLSPLFEKKPCSGSLFYCPWMAVPRLSYCGQSCPGMIHLKVAHLYPTGHLWAGKHRLAQAIVAASTKNGFRDTIIKASRRVPL